MGAAKAMVAGVNDIVQSGEKVILFDGVCNLCSSSVQFILRRDRRRTFKFASIQSDAGRQLYEQAGLDPSAPDSFVLVTPDKSLLRSDAALAIAHEFGGPWRLLGVFKIVPRLVRDWAYSLVARNRYRWFGKREECLVPTPELRERFLT
jgi:predicted DCC family thiol-disulfide oxidoreductase YuxK